MYRYALLLAVLATISFTASAGSIFKCKTPDGGIVFSDSRCRSVDTKMRVLTGQGTSSSIGGLSGAATQLNRMRRLRGYSQPTDQHIGQTQRQVSDISPGRPLIRRAVAA